MTLLLRPWLYSNMRPLSDGKRLLMGLLDEEAGGPAAFSAVFFFLSYSNFCFPRILTIILRTTHDKPAINNIVKWMQPLTSAWMGVLREYRGVGVAEAMPGAKLTELLCKGMRKLFTLHRKLLRNNQEYQGRTRDPPRVNLARALGSEPETEPEVDD